MTTTPNQHQSPSRVLVTGGAGYIGSVVAAQLVDAGHEVVVVDDLSTGHADAVPAGASFVPCGIAELGPVLAEHPVDAVIHFAAKSLVAESVLDPARYWHHNVAGTLALLEAMRARDVGRIVFSSSAAIYGEADESPIPETAPPRPMSAYGASKLAVELALSDYARAYGMAAVSLRYFNVAGALHNGAASYGERHATETHLIPLALRAVAGQAPELALYGTDYPTPDGTCIRDYVHVVDLADAHLRALSATEHGAHHVVNVGSGSGYSVREVIDAVRSATGRELPVRERPRRDGDPARLVAAIGTAAELLGWHPQRDLVRMVTDAWAFQSASTA